MQWRVDSKPGESLCWFECSGESDSKPVEILYCFECSEEFDSKPGDPLCWSSSVESLIRSQEKSC
eukprot:3748451-Pleurochrysis_carterae.AAC.1